MRPETSTVTMEGIKKARIIRVCLLADAADPHTVKWANYFAQQDYEVHILSFDPGRGLSKAVQLHLLTPDTHRNIRYFLAVSKARKLVNEIRPDIVHAHYATGYGMLGKLIGIRPYVVSVWGMDVFEFPDTSIFHRTLLRSVLASADHVCSTSHFMARRASQYCQKPITVTPFGVDCGLFAPATSQVRASSEFVIGTVKKLEPKYGIEYLIHAFARFVHQHTDVRSRLIIAGGGYLRRSLQDLARDLHVHEQTDFLGAVPHERVPEILSRFSVFAALSVSDSESFGVAVVEASACGLPVVVTRVGGLPEVVKDGRTGFIVPPCDHVAAAEAFSMLSQDWKLRASLGQAGREYVLSHYDWSENARRMEEVYKDLV